jgi:RNA polymerase sigma-70 factor (ECF subfamily)
MTDGNWSWVQISNDTFPEPAGKLRLEPDRRTCVLPCRLHPGRTYVVWLNQHDKYLNFQDTEGRPAVPYLLVFETKP